jgi:hypothetical protein
MAQRPEVAPATLGGDRTDSPRCTQSRKRVRTDNAVHQQATTVLEAVDRLSGQRPIATVDRAGCKAQSCEPTLQRAHTPRSRRLLVAGTGKQGIAGRRPQRSKGTWAGYGVDREADGTLKAVDRLGGQRTIEAVDRPRRKAQSCEPTLQCAHTAGAPVLVVAAAGCKQ